MFFIVVKTTQENFFSVLSKSVNHDKMNEGDHHMGTYLNPGNSGFSRIVNSD